MGRISRGEETEILWKKIKIYKNGGGEEYQIARNFIHTYQPTDAFQLPPSSADTSASQQMSAAEAFQHSPATTPVNVYHQQTANDLADSFNFPGADESMNYQAAKHLGKTC